MEKIVIASRNKNKIRELKILLEEYFPNTQFLSLDDVGIVEDIVEDGTTFAENAEIKARAASQGKYIGIADDSGLAVDALNGAPGVHSARYAQDVLGILDHDDEANNNVLLQQLANVKDPYRTGAYVCALCCIFPDGKKIVVEGKTCGRILFERRGKGGFGYDPLFYTPIYNKTFAELTLEEKNAISHRGEAARLLIEELKKLNEN